MKGRPLMNDANNAQVEWLEDAARYFEARPTFGEDMAHWANVHNAEMCRKIAAILAVRLDEAAIRKDEREKQREIDAKIAEHDDRQGEWPKSVDVSKTSPTRLMQTAIASAIRNGGKQP